ncbi:hypothetical protein ABC337_03635 [Arthrobacter sp. 1P04PC]|uniref:hypothetical protein n=1 Tax=unclassified Arthrobacter TaxID=235627 RepID=UPI0039A15740
MQLLEPAAQRSATDLFVLTHGRPGHSVTKKEFYEVTLVQFFYQYMLMSPLLRSYGIRWEAPFGTGGTNPKRVDLVLEPAPGAQSGQTMLVEAGRFTVQKLKEDSEKLRSLRQGMLPATGLKRVLLYWIGTDAPATAKAVREEIRKPMDNKSSKKRIGVTHIKPLWVMGCDLYPQTAKSPTQFSAVMVEVLP